MGKVEEAAKCWCELCKFEYVFTYGFKMKLTSVHLVFNASQFYHLAGFHYLNDLNFPRYNSKKILEKIVNGKITSEFVTRSSNYFTKVEPRLDSIINLKETLDSDFALYSFKKDIVPFYTKIDADYLIRSSVQDDSFTFILKKEDSDFHICLSTFTKSSNDYSKNQRRFTLLKKERIELESKIVLVLYKKEGLTESLKMSNDLNAL